jgi:molecular chaperone GrpE
VTDAPHDVPADRGDEVTAEEAAEAEVVAEAVDLVDQAVGEVLVLTRERDEYLDTLRRLQADFENYKKRVTKQQYDQLERANEGLVAKLLPVLDTTDLALSHGAGDEVAQVRQALLDALHKEGLERLDPQGDSFDPNQHDAVAHEPGDGGAQQVAEVLRAGYLWKGRVLRPAMVKVRG